MQVVRGGLTLLMALSICGCGGAGGALRQPLMVKCENAGLSSCRSIATGMVTYVDGDTKAAKAILNQAALTNSQQTLTQYI